MSEHHELYEKDALLAVAKNEGLLRQVAQDSLARSTEDGLIVMEWLKKHHELYILMYDQCQRHGVPQDDLDKAVQLTGKADDVF